MAWAVPDHLEDLSLGRMYTLGTAEESSGAALGTLPTWIRLLSTYLTTGGHPGEQRFIWSDDGHRGSTTKDQQKAFVPQGPGWENRQVPKCVFILSAELPHIFTRYTRTDF